MTHQGEPWPTQPLQIYGVGHTIENRVCYTKASKLNTVLNRLKIERIASKNEKLASQADPTKCEADLEK